MRPGSFYGLVVDPDDLPTYEPSPLGFYPVSIDSNGRVLISGESTVAIAGTDTPGDARTNPTTNVPVTAFNEYWNAILGQWFRVNCIDLNNQDIPASPDPFYALSTYSVAGGLDELTALYSVFAQRTPTDAMVNPAADALLPLDTLGRTMLWDPDAPNEPDPTGLWRRGKADGAGNLVSLGGVPPATGAANCPSFDSRLNGIRGLPKTSAGKLLAFSLDIAIDEADLPVYLMFFDSASLPVDNDLPVSGGVFRLTSDFQIKQLGREYFGEGGMLFSDGIAWALSSTGGDLTLIAASDSTMNVSFV